MLCAWFHRASMSRILVMAAGLPERLHSMWCCAPATPSIGCGLEPMNAQVRAISDQVSPGLLSQVLRQLNHWEGAAERLDDFEATASPEAWASLERYVGVTLRAGLRDARDQLKREAIAVRATFNAVRSRADLERIADQVALL